MNAKRVKAFRRSMRELGISETDVVYDAGYRGGTITLDPKCGRGMYRAAKKDYRKRAIA
jgi:hypothetical protein